MARESTSVRLSALDRDRIGKLREMLDASTGQVLGEALCHFLATLEKDEAIYRRVPSERRPAVPDRTV